MVGEQDQELWRVVMLHGVRTSGSMWRRQVEALTERGHVVIPVDFPGHGKNRERQLSLESAYQEIQNAAWPSGPESSDEATATRPTAVVGLSLGGYLGLYWSARTPQPPQALIVSSATAIPGGVLNRGYAAVTDAFAALPEDGATRAADVSARLVLNREAVEDISRGGISVKGQQQAIRAMMAADPITDVRTVAERGIKLTFIQGELDHFRIHERRFREAAGPEADWRLIRGAIHMVNVHKPQAYTAALLDALRESWPGSD